MGEVVTEAQTNSNDMLLITNIFVAFWKSLKMLHYARQRIVFVTF